LSCKNRTFTDNDLEIKSVLYRKNILKYIKHANAGHTGGSLSCVDILNVLYNRIMNVTPDTFSDPLRDRFILSKGHSVEALYVVLSDQGFFPESELETLCRYKSHYVGHPTRKVRGIEQNTGALGHGLAMSAGIALAGKMDDRDYRVYTLLGDGELAEGSNWEAMLSAAHYKLDNLTAIVDYNQLQITGLTRDVCCTDPLDEKFRAFGWNVRSVNGHEISEIISTLNSVPFESEKPNMIIAHTEKGHGISFMGKNVSWHHKVPSNDQYDLAIKELDLQLQRLNTTIC